MTIHLSTSDLLWSVASNTNSNITNYVGKAAAVSYMETSIGVTYNFGVQSDSNTTAYIIPTPAELSTNTSARWLSDIIIINPSCSFMKTNISEPFIANETDYSFAVNLPDAGIDVIIDYSLDCAQTHALCHQFQVDI